MGPDPFEDALTKLERGRRERTVVAVVIILASIATVVVIAAATGFATWPAATGVAAGILVVVVVAHVVSLLVREERSERATRALLAARASLAAEEARERTLETLHTAARAVTSSLDLEKVVDASVDAARAVSDAGAAVLLLHAGDELVVAASSGLDVPSRGTRRGVTAGDRRVLEGGQTVLGGRGADWGDGPASIAAPLALPDRVIGSLVVRRGVRDRPFAEHERLAVALLAEHVALALRNATEHDRERQRSEAFRGLIGLLPDGPADAPPPDEIR